MDKTANILLCGVGGQGILLASEIISSALMNAGYDVKQSEVHGMAQRGGSVISHIRFGKKVYSPLIEPGSADIVVSFEMLEALRYLPYMNKKTRVIVNTQKILPAPVATGIDTYPQDILDRLRQRGLAVFPVDAFETAKSMGETRAVNMILVGALSAFLSLDEKVFLQVITGRIPEKIRKVNTEAFIKGRETVSALQKKKTKQLRSN
ncbi:MAG: indolepyruvate oxidoreductase subunit beta [Nitrospirae bacterium]|nr:indolepyruvate oxidoreductase subunit beta [Nitrospirota bacterium]MCL5422071.1 indolepyruvate oxidoreductase subunit beta [Nitrospirota bacterium]